MMGKDRRAWRKLVKKIQRSRRRKIKAGIEPGQAKLQAQSHRIDNDGSSSESSEEAEALCEVNEAEAAYWEREKEAQLQFHNKQEAIARERTEREEMQIRQRAEQEAAKEKQRILAVEKKAQKELAKIQQEEKLDELLEFLSGDLENPPQKYLMPDSSDDEGKEPCLYYSKTGACRFFDRCKQAHLQPILSCTILIQNFFNYFYIQQGINKNSFVTDLTLEYEESDAYKEFLQFYDDVMPEFQSIGKVVQFKVCNNFEPHMRGNVYIQYDTVKESVQAYRVLNARFYGGKQLTVQFVRIPSWRGAICGKYCRNRCDKGKTCNYIHAFRNPTKEFIEADNDWPEPPTRRHSRDSREKLRNRSDRAYDSPSSSPESDLEYATEVRSPASSTTSDPDKDTPESSPKHPKAKKRKRSDSVGTSRKTRSDDKKRTSSERRSSNSRSNSDSYASRKHSSTHRHKQMSSSDEDSRRRSPKRRKNETEKKSRHHHKSRSKSSCNDHTRERKSSSSRRFHDEGDYYSSSEPRSRSSSGGRSLRQEKTETRHRSQEKDKNKEDASRKHRHKHRR